MEPKGFHQEELAGGLVACPAGFLPHLLDFLAVTESLKRESPVQIRLEVQRS